MKNRLFAAFTFSEFAMLPFFFVPWFTCKSYKDHANLAMLALGLVAIQLIFIFWYVKRTWSGKTAGSGTELFLTVCMELAVVSVPAALMLVFANRTYGIGPVALTHTYSGGSAARPAFWIALALSVLSVLLYQAYILCRRGRE